MILGLKKPSGHNTILATAASSGSKDVFQAALCALRDEFGDSEVCDPSYCIFFWVSESDAVALNQDPRSTSFSFVGRGEGI